MKFVKNPIPGRKAFSGCTQLAAEFLQREQLTDTVQWQRFADQFRQGIDGSNRGWRGEYWGKMMRGAVLVYEYTREDALYEILTQSVKDMLTVAEPDGRVSSYSRETEFDAWDLWCRKYVLLGMEYYLDICREEALKAQILTFLCRHLDYIMAHIGEGKKCITRASRAWLGVNSSSILEPVVWLYKLTQDKRYLDFAGYIVRCGGAEGVNIFELAYENKVMPYQYGVNKAYEMMSCFEGLLEYALITGSEKYITACVNFTKAVLETDVSVIGSCGCTDELLDHTRTRQTAQPPRVLQETCVTVTWMKLCSRLLLLTGERCFADAMEQSFYNAYLGALNLRHNKCAFVMEHFEKKGLTEGLVDTFLPFDSYSPLRPGKRGELVGGLQRLKDGSYYGCCTSIGAAGVGVFAGFSTLARADGLSIEFYEEGTQTLTVGDKTVTVTMRTRYPAEGKIALHVEGLGEEKLYLRLPGWCDSFRADKPCKLKDGYLVFAGEEDIGLELDMPVKAVLPETWEEDTVWIDRSNPPPNWSTTGPRKVYHDPKDDKFVAFTRGPLTLCADSRTGKKADSVFAPVLPPVATLSHDAQIIPGEPCLVKCHLESLDGQPITLVDYASAGRDWKTTIAAWLPTE